MGLSASKQWNEMNEVNQALEETENQVKNSSSAEKKSFKNKLKSRILKSGIQNTSYSYLWSKKYNLYVL